ncbi:MAG: hypothetical protein C0478_04370 [Planctomyces sp.]|nr:hypothetical protein [Planctomyces sp.]
MSDRDPHPLPVFHWLPRPKRGWVAALLVAMTFFVGCGAAPRDGAQAKHSAGDAAGTAESDLGSPNDAPAFPPDPLAFSPDTSPSGSRTDRIGGLDGFSTSAANGPLLPELPPQSEPPIPGIPATSAPSGEAPPFPGDLPATTYETVTITSNGMAAMEPGVVEFHEITPKDGSPTTTRSAPALSPMAKGSPDQGFSRETIYFATNRNRTGATNASQAYGTHRGDLQWGMCQVSIPYKHKPGELESKAWYQWSEDPKQHIVLMDPLDHLSEANWMTRLREKLAGASASEILVFVHGYNTTFDNAVRRTAQLSYDLNFPGAAVCFSWPAGNNMVYTTDWNNAEWSLPHCQHVLKQLALFSRAEKIHIVAHSMGSRVVTFSLKELIRDMPLVENQPLFNQVILAAPDLDADIFRTQIAPSIQRATRRLTIYASEQDVALKLSQGLNGGTRLGSATQVSLTDQVSREWIDCIDATSMTKEALMSFQHAYYGDSPRMIGDLRRVLAGENATTRGLLCEKPGLFQIR